MDIESSPRTLVFKNMAIGQQDTKELTLKIKQPDKVKVTSVSCSNELFTVTKKDDEHYDITFKGTNEVGAVSGKIKVEYTGGDKPSMDVVARAIVVGDLKFSKALYFTKDGDSFKPQEITITSRSGKNVKITGFKDADGKLKTEITENDVPRAKIMVELVDPKASYPTTSRHQLNILTSDKAQPEIKIRYMISDEPFKGRGKGRGRAMKSIDRYGPGRGPKPQ